MSSNEIETNDVNGSRSQSKDPRPAGVLDRGILVNRVNCVISKRRKWTSQENKIIIQCNLMSEPKIRGCKKLMPSLWLQKSMFWVSEQRLVDQANTIRRNS